MNSFTTIEKYAIVKVLSHIMKADGIIHPKEEEYMNQTYSDFSITIHDIEDISNIDDIQSNSLSVECPMRIKLLQRLCLLEWLRLME